MTEDSFFHPAIVYTLSGAFEVPPLAFDKYPEGWTILLDVVEWRGEPRYAAWACCGDSQIFLGTGRQVSPPHPLFIKELASRENHD